MKSKKRMGIGLLAVCILGIGYYFYGLFTPYSYFTAKFDVLNGKVQLLTYGLPKPSEALESRIAAEFGFSKHAVVGCLVSGVFINGVAQYNAFVKTYLAEKHGKNWEEKFNRRCQEELKKQIK